MNAPEQLAQVADMRARIAELEGLCEQQGLEIRELDHEKRGGYLQRNYLVAVLTRVFPAGIRKTHIEGWSEHWQNCVYVDLPSGQVSYHYPDSQAHLFAHLPEYLKPYDGHSKEDVHDRLMALPDLPETQKKFVMGFLNLRTK